MKCIICSGNMRPYFAKHFDNITLDLVQYWRCESCGFVASKTHFDMPENQWQKLNLSFHSTERAKKSDPNSNSRHFNQALMLYILAKGEVITKGNWLDWGSGPGNVSLLLDNWFSIRLNNYDTYCKPKMYSMSLNQLKQRDFDLVLSSAVFEHVRNRNTLDEIESYVSEQGSLAVHTLVRGDIPSDPEWMYLLPVHCSFHTNRSMQILMDQWNYRCSVYNEHSKLWIVFKKTEKEIHDKVEQMNLALGFEYLHFKEGFMDYWP